MQSRLARSPLTSLVNWSLIDRVARLATMPLRLGFNQAQATLFSLALDFYIPHAWSLIDQYAWLLACRFLRCISNSLCNTHVLANARFGTLLAMYLLPSKSLSQRNRTMQVPLITISHVSQIDVMLAGSFVRLAGVTPAQLAASCKSLCLSPRYVGRSLDGGAVYNIV